MATYAGVMKAINNLTKPLQEKILKKLGLSTKDLPGRSSNKAGITVGKERLRIEKKIDKLKGGAVGVGGTVVAYEASDFIGDMLGIKKVGDATLKGNEKPFVPKSKRKGPPARVATKKKSKPPEPPKSRPKVTKKVEDKKKQLMMKEKYSGKDSNVKFNARGGMMKKYSKGGMTKKGKK